MEVVLLVERAVDHLGKHRADRVHDEAALGAAVDESPRRAALPAQVARPGQPGAADWDAAQPDGVPRVREEGDALLEVVGAGLVRVEVAGVAPVADEAGEPGPAQVAGVGGRAAVLGPHEGVRVGEVFSGRRHGSGALCSDASECVLVWVGSFGFGKLIMERM